MIISYVSPYLTAVFMAWFGSHLAKYLVSMIKGEKMKFSLRIFESGGMPSSHTATVVALATIIGLRDGFNTGLFGLSGLFAAIVAYDAIKVRRSSGEQGIAVKELIREQNSNVSVPRISKGHTPLEVFIGAIFGSIIGIVVFLSTI